jgi:hypothetical protein
MATPSPTSGNQTEQLLAEPEVQQFVGEIDRAITSSLGPAQTEMTGVAYHWGKRLLTRPMALYISSAVIGPQGPDVRGGLVVNMGDQAAELKATLEKYQALLPAAAVEKTTVETLPCYRLSLPHGGPVITWGMKGKYLLAGIGPGGMEGILRRAKGTAPAWLTRVREQLPVERESTVMFVNTKKLIEQFAPLGGPKAQTILDATGLGGVTSLAAVTGLDSRGCVSRVLVSIDGEPAGLLHTLAGKPLTAADLTPIPQDATVAVAARLDAKDAFDAIMEMIGKVDPPQREPVSSTVMAGGLQQLEKQLGIDLRKDLLSSLGDVWCVYNSPGEGGFLVTGLTAVAPVKDHERLAAVQAKLLAQAKAALAPPRSREEEEEELGPPRPRPTIRKIQFSGQDIYFVSAGDNGLPVAPAWCLTEKELIVATFPQQIKAYLARGEEAKSLAAVPEVAALFQNGGPVGLSYVDDRKLLEVMYPFACMMGHTISGELARAGGPGGAGSPGRLGSGGAGGAGGAGGSGLDFNMGSLPSAVAIAKHLRPSVGAVRRTPVGIEFSSHGTLPGGSSLGSVWPMAAFSMFWVRKAEVRHFERAPALRALREESEPPTTIPVDPPARHR